MIQFAQECKNDIFVFCFQSQQDIENFKAELEQRALEISPTQAK